MNDHRETGNDSISWLVDINHVITDPFRLVKSSIGQIHKKIKIWSFLCQFIKESRIVIHLSNMKIKYNYIYFYFLFSNKFAIKVEHHIHIASSRKLHSGHNSVIIIRLIKIENLLREKWEFFAIILHTMEISPFFNRI